MTARGFRVEATDGARGMVEEARRRTGLDVRLERFDQLEAADAYDGVWASFSLLHAPRAEAPALLARVRRALRANGVLFLGVKAADVTMEQRDTLGRRYTDYARDDMEQLLRAGGYDVSWVGDGGGVGMDGVPSRHLYALARRTD